MKYHGNKWRNWVLLCCVILIVTMTLWGCEGGDSAQEPEQTETTSEVPSETETPEMDEEQLSRLFGSGQGLEEIYYEMKMTGFEMDDTKTRIWMKGGRMRTESEVEGQLYIMIYDEDAFYTLDPQSKTAMKASMDVGVDESMDPYTAQDFTSDVDDQQLQYQSKENVNGIPCYVVQSIETGSGYGVKMWLHEEYGFPIKVEGLSNQADEQYTMEVTEFEVGNVSNSKFDIPKDYQIMDMSSMWENMSDMPDVPGD